MCLHESTHIRTGMNICHIFLYYAKTKKKLREIKYEILNIFMDIIKRRINTNNYDERIHIE